MQSPILQQRARYRLIPKNRTSYRDFGPARFMRFRGLLLGFCVFFIASFFRFSIHIVIGLFLTFFFTFRELAKNETRGATTTWHIFIEKRETWFKYLLPVESNPAGLEHKTVPLLLS